MTQDEIIEMAREAGMMSEVLQLGRNLELLTDFAKLVAKHTLMNIDPSSFMSFQEGVETGRLAEREACAKLCAEDGVQAMDFTGGTFVGGYFAKRIMERNKHGTVSDQQV